MAEEGDQVNFPETLSADNAKTIQRVATLQNSALAKLQRQGAKLGHLLSTMHGATHALSVLNNGGSTVRRNDDPAENWKREPGGKYDGGSTVALDNLIAASAERMLAIVEDDKEWSMETDEDIGKNIGDWSRFESLSAYYQASAAKAKRRPCVMHPVQLFQGAQDLWYAVMVPFNVRDKVPVIGVGGTPLDAMGDFDRVFASGDYNPAALLWLEEQRKYEEAQAKRKCGTKAKPRKGTK